MKLPATNNYFLNNLRVYGVYFGKQIYFKRMALNNLHFRSMNKFNISKRYSNKSESQVKLC